MKDRQAILERLKDLKEMSLRDPKNIRLYQIWEDALNWVIDSNVYADLCEYVGIKNYDGKLPEFTSEKQIKLLLELLPDIGKKGDFIILSRSDVAVRGEYFTEVLCEFTLQLLRQDNITTPERVREILE